MDTRESSRWWQPLSAVTVGVALFVSWGHGGAIASLNSGTFLLAVMVIALVGGTGPGLNAAGL